MYNTLVKTNHLEEFKTQFSFFEDCGYGDLNYDALWKWSSILNAFHKLYGENPKFETCVDIGGGASPIYLYLSNYGNVKNVDHITDGYGMHQTWFPLDDNGIFYKNSSGFTYNENNIERINSDFLSYIKELPDNSVDLYVDGCSLIHMNPTPNETHHDGIYEIGSHIKRTLKPGGFFISSCDVVNPHLHYAWKTIMTTDGVTYPELLFNVYNKAGLLPIDSGDFNVEDFYKDFENRIEPICCDVHHCNSPKYSKRNHLPDYHAFQQYDRLPMLMARFVFTK